MLFFSSPWLKAQQKPELNFSGYLEAYYSYDFNRPEDHERPDQLFNYKRHNEVSINLAYLNAGFKQENARGELALMVGNYSQYNLAKEPSWAQLVYKAYAGVRLMKGLWLDVGIMPSHIGFESAEGASCWHLSRGLLAENSPYYLSGARLTYEKPEKWEFVLWLTNGWQNIQRRDRNQSLGIGAGVTYTPVDRLKINYSNYFGNEYPQTLRLNRFFNDFYVQYGFASWSILGAVDYGIEDTPFGFFNQWWGVNASLRKVINEDFSLAARWEHYSDPKGVILENGARVSGYSLNCDWQIASAVLGRLEWRQLESPSAIFEKPAGRLSRGNTAISGSLSFKF